MKRIYLITLLLTILLSSSLLAQNEVEPVKWEHQSTHLGNHLFELVFKANIDQGWAVYSQELEEGGPLPSVFEFEDEGAKGAQLQGKIEEVGQLKEEFDAIFEMNVRKYYNQLTFKAKVKTTQPEVAIEVPLLYMSCNDEACVRLEEFFNFTLKATPIALPQPTPPPVAQPKSALPPPVAQPKSALPPPVEQPKSALPPPVEQSKSTALPPPVEQPKSTAESTSTKEGIKSTITPASAGQTKPIAAEKKTEKKNVDGSKSVEKTALNKNDPPETTANNIKASALTAIKESVVANKTEMDKPTSFGLTNEVPQTGEEDQEKAPEETPKKKKKKVKRTSSSNDDGAKTGHNRQILEPVKWRFDKKELGNNVSELLLTADISSGWYVYSQDIETGGPIPTNITFVPNANVVFIDEKPREISTYKKEGFDKMFDMNIVKYAKEVTFAQKVKLKDPNAKIEGSFLFQTCDDARCLPPNKQKFTFNDQGKHGIVALKGPVKEDKGKEWKEVIAHCGIATSQSTGATSWWRIFILGLLGGFAALLTPCVFPMIPLTVSFFTKRSKNKSEGLRNAFIYAISIIVIYVGLGFFVTVAFGPSVLNALSTDPWFNLFFFVIFVVFAISFFGYFEITLPSSFVNKISAAEEKGGLIGIFFMAFTLALVSFSCTGPIIGTLLVEAAVNGEQAGPILGMTGFAVALALPFALFAAFPGWLNSLPRSGGWLNTVKVVLGFIELIFALKFLSNADLTPQLGLLKREVFLGIWILLLLGLALYLIGKIRFPHDSPLQKITLPRMATSAFCVLFAGYLVQGIFCQPLPLVSGFPPPIFYSYSCGGDHANIAAEKHIADLEKGIVEAEKEGKPLLVDFTGWACVNCRKMEENVWSKMPDLLEKYTIVSLYVDEKKNLPESEQFIYEINNKKRRVRTVGDKWSYLQSTCLGTNTQPYYVLMNEKGEFLNQPVGYTPNLVEYSQFLEEGLKNYQAGKTIEDVLGMAK